jgi:hypothetical protein
MAARRRKTEEAGQNKDQGEIIRAAGSPALKQIWFA